MGFFKCENIHKTKQNKQKHSTNIFQTSRGKKFKEKINPRQEKIKQKHGKNTKIRKKKSIIN